MHAMRPRSLFFASRRRRRHHRPADELHRTWRLSLPFGTVRLLADDRGRAHNRKIEASAMAPKKIRARDRVADVRQLIEKLRKPLAPPTLTHPDERKYSRVRERERLRRAERDAIPDSEKSQASD